MEDNFEPSYVISSQALDTSDCNGEIRPESNRVIRSAGLGPLNKTIGPTWTLPPQPGSPAIGAGGRDDDNRCPGTDQTGFSRLERTCDIGAVQFRGKVPFVSLRLRTGPGRIALGSVRRKVVVRASYKGDGVAPRSKVCVRIGQWVEELRVEGRRCRSLGTLSRAVKRKTVFWFSARHRESSKFRSARVRFVLSSPEFVSRSDSVWVHRAP